MPYRQEKREKKNFFITLKKYLTPIVVVVSVLVFFLSYNTYLVDHSLDDLKFALDQTSRAQTFGETEKIGMILDDLLINELSSPGVNSYNMVSLEFTKNIVNRGGAKGQLKDIEFLLDKMVKNKEKNRGGLLIAFDRMNQDLQRFIKFITKELPKGALRTEIFQSGPVDLKILAAAKQYELDWKLKEAASAYGEFIDKYPTYPQIKIVKIRLADVYFKSLDYRGARHIYEKLIEEAPQSDEAKVAEVVLKKVDERIRKESEKGKLKLTMSRLMEGGPVQTHYKELAAVDSYLQKLDKETLDLTVYVMKGVEESPKPAPGETDTTLLAKAKDYDSKWMFRESQAAYEEFISKNPSYEGIISAKLLLGGVYLKSGQYQRALAYYEQIVSNYPDAKENIIARKFVDKTKEVISISGKRSILIDNIKRTKAAPELAQAYYSLGMVDTYLFNFDSALESFNKTVAFLPESDLAKRAAFNIGWIYKYKAQSNKAVTEFSKFIEKYPKDKLVLDTKYQIADSYYKANNYEEAAKLYESFSEKYPNTNTASLALLQAGYTYLYNLHDPLRAAEIFKKLKVLYPETDATAYAVINLVPTAERSYRDYGFLLLRENKFLEAKNAFNKALVIDRNDAWAYCGLGTVNVMMVLVDEGIKSAVEGVKRIPDEYTHAALAFTYDESKNYEKAAEEYKLSVKINPGYLVSRYNLGRDYAILGWSDYAITEFKEALKLAPNFAEARNNLGYAYWQKGRAVEAEFEFKAAILNKKDLSEAHYNLGLVYESVGKYSKAVDCFRRVLSIMPNSELTKKHLNSAESKIKR